MDTKQYVKSDKHNEIELYFF